MVGETTPLLLERTLNEEEDDEHKRRYVVSSLELEDDNAVVVAHSYHCLKNTALLTLLCGVVVIVIAAVSNLQDAPHDFSSAAVNYLFSSRPYKWLPLTPVARLGRVRNSTAKNGNRPSSTRTETSVAFLGNSMLYFNDFPRFFETISVDRKVIQNSCLHGSASIATLLDGSGMYPKFKTHNAILGKDKYGQYIHDYGACTVSQLLLGQDVQLNNANYDKGGGQQQQLTTTNSKNVNPCNADIAYREYNTYIINQQQSRSMTDNVAVWDYVVINDNTLHPARHETRHQSLRALEQYYLPWLLEIKSIPVFIWTYAYSRADNSMSCDDGGGGDNTSGSSRSRTRTKEARDMTGLEDIAKFTQLTGTGYEEYAKLLATHLPTTQVPRIAPVGLAYLAVHDENYEVWQSLFHCDGLHASPAGTFLQGCIIYYTLFGVMPSKDVVLRENMSTLWTRARMMQHAWDPPNPYPDKSMATYLYEVAERIMVEGYKPKSYSTE